MAVLIKPVVSRLRRSREGTWIEIHRHIHFLHINARRSRDGAWIEICHSI